MRRLLRHPAIWVVASVAVIGLVIGLALFQPWKLFTHSRIDEAIPSAAPTQPEELAKGTFVSHEHTTSGTARVLRLPDGSRLLRLEGFSTSDGPDVHVWLTDATADGPGGSFDDGRYVQLGELKATDGNHNYPIPADAKLTGLTSVVIWCDRFNSAFGAAPLTLPATADVS